MNLLFIVSQWIVPMSSDELEELNDALGFHFWLSVWAPRILERASIFSKLPRQVHS